MSYRGRILPRVLAASLLALTVGCGSSPTVVSTQCLPSGPVDQKAPTLVLVYSDGTLKFAQANKPGVSVRCYPPYNQGQVTVNNIGN